MKPMTYKHILVPFDESPLARAAIPVLVTGGAAASAPGSVAMPAGAHEA